MVLDDEESGSVTVTSGVPQGSVLGPKIIVDIYIYNAEIFVKEQRINTVFCGHIFNTLFIFSTSDGYRRGYGM